jgi:hypothetical protein
VLLLSLRSGHVCQRQSEPQLPRPTDRRVTLEAAERGGVWGGLSGRSPISNWPAPRGFSSPPGLAPT